jgi:hypothetical protein
MIKTEMDSMPTELDEHLSRKIMQLEIEETSALKKEQDNLSKERLSRTCKRSLPSCAIKFNAHEGAVGE